MWFSCVHGSNYIDKDFVHFKSPPECSAATPYGNCSDQELFGMEDLEPTEPLLKPKNSKEAHSGKLLTAENW